jgi:hypothetical protein
VTATIWEFHGNSGDSYEQAVFKPVPSRFTTGSEPVAGAVAGFFRGNFAITGRTGPQRTQEAVRTEPGGRQATPSLCVFCGSSDFSVLAGYSGPRGGCPGPGPQTRCIAFGKGSHRRSNAGGDPNPTRHLSLWANSMGGKTGGLASLLVQVSEPPLRLRQSGPHTRRSVPCLPRKNSPPRCPYHAIGEKR